MLLEYGHAMGNSPGLMEDAWDYVYKNRHICGGFLWEFKNHGFYSEDENGTPYYKYGGDFGDINHWSNFSMDGYCLSDGTVKPSLRDCKNVLAPTYITYDGENIILTNTNDFRPLDYIRMKWDVCEDFHVLKSGEEALVPLNPYESMCLSINKNVDNPVPGAKYFVNMRFYNEKDEEIAYKQVFLKEEKREEGFEKGSIRAEVSTRGDNISVSLEDVKIEISGGLLSGFEKGGKRLLDKQMKLMIYRAPTDNDGIVNWSERWIKEWNSKFYNDFEFILLKQKVEKRDDSVIIKAAGKWTAVSRFVGFDVEFTYMVVNGGNIITEIHAIPYGAHAETLPRLGVMFTLDKSMDSAMWYGRGEDENYCDRKAHCNFGLYQKKVSDMNFIYDVPQECGTRTDNYFLSVKDENCGFSVIGADSFVFSYHDFTLENLILARHRNELSKADENYLYIDYAMRGLGSHSCGPNPEECYELRPHEFKFAFVITAEIDEEKLLDLSRKNYGIKSEKITSVYVYEERMQRKNRIECNINKY